MDRKQQVESGRRGGLATKMVYGVDHFRLIGALGGKATAVKKDKPEPPAAPPR